MGPGWVGFIFNFFFLAKVSYVAQACLKLIAFLLSTGVIGVNHHVRFELAFFTCVCVYLHVHMHVLFFEKGSFFFLRCIYFSYMITLSVS